MTNNEYNAHSAGIWELEVNKIKATLMSSAGNVDTNL